MKQFEITVNLTCFLTAEEINSLMVTALEGGINYWCARCTIWTNPENAEYASDVISGGGSLKLYEKDDPGSYKILNQPRLLDAIATYCSRESISAKEMYENHDAEVVDQIIQYALFGEIVYG
jgi:hypothetical protein